MPRTHHLPAVLLIAASLVTATCGDPTSSNGAALRFSSVVAGGDFSCGLGTDSLAYCWGRIPNLGYTPQDNLQSQVRPVAVNGDHRFRRIEAGVSKACGFEFGGALYCWGSELLGDGSVDRDSVPQLVGGGLVLASVSIAGTDACGLTPDGTAYCWGRNEYGQLGIGRKSDYEPFPVAVAGGALKFKQVAPGIIHACGIALDDHLYCWGNNTFSQLGTDATPDICFPGNPPQCAFMPVAVADTQRYMTVAAGAYYNCGLTFAGQAFCWGNGPDGELGTAFANAPTPEAVVTDLRFATLESGLIANCALTATGAAYCWGNNEWGQLGTSNPTYTCPSQPHPECSPFPEPVSGGLVFRSVSTHVGHTCAMTRDGLAYCWGSGAWGQMGDGDPRDHISYTPIRVIDQADPPP